MVFDAFIQQYPRIAIILISLVMTLFITVVRYFMTDREKMKEIRDRQKKLRAEMKLYKNHPEKMMEDFPEQMRQSFKPMIITIIPVLLLFTWMKAVFVATAIANTWLWWYIGASIVLSIIVSKLFGLQ